ncbi:MAG TPA: hypothetical protein DCQ83_03180 [Fibrobacteres bacterium]|nr:hypothetical protein [Fibrobacterota bacterium]
MRIEERHIADVFGLTYREFAGVRSTHYQWRLLAPEAVQNLRRAEIERWSPEKIAEYLNCDAQEAAQKLRRYIMSRHVNEEENTPERITVLFQEWLGSV